MYQRRERKLNRLREYDYSQAGWYFITICTQNRECLFGEVKYGEMVLNKFGKIVENQWLGLEKHFDCIHLDEWIIMPNHLHGIIELLKNNNVGNAQVGNAQVRSLQDDRTKMLLSKIIHGFKAAVTKEINKIQNDLHFQWQKSFYDHIIRDERDLNRIRKYIIENPIKWEFDQRNIENLYL